MTAFALIPHAAAQEIVNQHWSPGKLRPGRFWLAEGIRQEDEMPPDAEGYFLFVRREGCNLTLAYVYDPLPPPEKKKRQRKAKVVEPKPVARVQLSLF